MSNPKTVTITLTYASLEDAFADLAGIQQVPYTVNVSGSSNAPRDDVPPTEEQQTGAQVVVDPQPVVEKKARKPRSDAGQPRGPYKTTTESAAPSPAPFEATEATAPTPAADPVPEVQSAPKELTIDDVKAAMVILAKKHNIEANMKQLAAFGVQKVSMLPREKYADFIAAVRKAAGV